MLLDACRVPSAVCGYRGLSLSPLGQAALLRFLEVPETFFATQPEAAQITKIASGTLKKYLYCQSNNGATQEKTFDYLDIICDDDDAEDDIVRQFSPPSSLQENHHEKDGKTGSGSSSSSSNTPNTVNITTEIVRRYKKVLHFRCFVWILISGCLKKLALGVVFKPFSNYDEIRDKLIEIRRSSDSSSIPTSGPYRYLATSFSQIDLDIWRTKVNFRPLFHI